jgi:dipeptidyl aminopeptidase/acylaminoacyl peptidase
MKKILAFAFILAAIAASSQTNNKSPLELREIMKGKDFIGYWPENQAWHVDGDKILFRWNSENELGMSWYSYNIISGLTEKVELENQKALLFYDRDQASYTKQYTSQNGNLISYDKKTKEQRIVIATNERIFNVQRLNEPTLIVFQQGNNLYQYNEKIGSIVQLTNIKLEDEKPDSKLENSLEIQQTELFQYIRDEKAEEEWRKQQGKSKKSNSSQYLGKVDLDYLRISKDGKNVYVRTSSKTNNKNTHVENHITQNGYTRADDARPKVGEEESNHQVFVYHIENDTLISLDFSELKDIRKKPDFLKEYGDEEATYKADRKIIHHAPIFSKNGKTVMDIRSYDNKDRWVVAIDNETGKFNLLDHQHDEAWIGGPGISSWNAGGETMGWMNNDKEIYFQSEVSGYAHLYIYNFESNTKRQLTQGKYEVHKVSLSLDDKFFYISANKNHPGNRELYKLQISNSALTSIFNQTGAVDGELSPNEQQWAILQSTKTEPWELFIAKNQSNTKLQKITSSKSDPFKAYTWKTPEVITFKGEDGKDVYARVYSPTTATKNDAAVVFVHGAGYLQNAHHFWSNYYREFMFHNLLADNGYTVIDIDYRASEGYGRDYRTAIYRHMGGMDLKDQISGKNFLTEKYGIDPKRVGIYGGSYGGFITLMALLTKPDEFASGAALRSVTDWAHYNHEYTSNILNYPENDPVAYKRSSPIYFAENLKKPLIMLHGMVDDNVQFQDIVRLSQRFIELEKTDWELAVFPIEAHGFQKSYSWTDEYRRIFELFNRTLLK